MSESEIVRRFKHNPTDEMINILAQLNACDPNRVVDIVIGAGFKRKNDGMHSWEFISEKSMVTANLAFPDLEEKSRAYFIGKPKTFPKIQSSWFDKKEENSMEKENDKITVKKKEKPLLDDSKISAKNTSLANSAEEIKCKGEGVGVRNSKFMQIPENKKMAAYAFYLEGNSLKKVAAEFGLTDYCTRRIINEFKNDPVDKNNPKRKHLVSELNLSSGLNLSSTEESFKKSKSSESKSLKNTGKSFIIDFSELKNNPELYNLTVSLFVDNLETEIEQTKKRLEMLEQIKAFIKTKE